MTFDWQHWAGTVNTMVDDYWGEPVRLIPWNKGSYATGGPDNTRAIRETRGVYIEGDPSTASTTPGGARRLATGEFAVSLNSSEFVGFRQGDRVHFPGRNATFEVSLEDGDPYGRSLVKLIMAL